jgi:hypothetical protein
VSRRGRSLRRARSRDLNLSGLAFGNAHGSMA